MLVSVVLPACDEAENIPEMTARLSAVLRTKGDYELIFVDDGSRDASLPLLRSMSASDTRIRYVSFSRNFGHQNALRAGLERARGEVVAMMDADLQHPPELLSEMLVRLEQGFDIVGTLRMDGKSPAGLKRATSSLFYRLMNRLGDIRIEPGSADFRLLSRRAVDLLLSMPERNLFWRGAVAWTGLPTAMIPYEAAPRRRGRTKYGFRKMLAFAMDGITSFSVRPLRITSALGAAISFLAFLYALYALGMRIFTDRTVEGWTSLLISVLLVGGL
ncbi:MAG: glycosyltransferase family 2 protein, partial [Rectinema sp.]